MNTIEALSHMLGKAQGVVDEAGKQIDIGYEATVIRREYDSLRAAKTGSCDWTEDEDGIWYTGCGNAFEFAWKGPTENNFSHCPYCGGLLRQEDK